MSTPVRLWEPFPKRPRRNEAAMLKLMYITNDPRTARIAEEAGVDRIFVDLETVGKALRQGGMNTVQSHHTLNDIRTLRKVLSKAELLVRVNQIYPGSGEEIDEAIRAGADILMLPYFKCAEQVRTFLRFVGGRTKTMLLFETPESVECLDEILALDGIDECFIGLNDLHLGYHRKFMFELLADGTVEMLCRRFADAGMPYGFGGIARVGAGMLTAERILGEHVRLKSSAVILSRSFCNTTEITDYKEIDAIFRTEVPKIRDAEREFQKLDAKGLAANHLLVQKAVQKITEKMG